MSWKDRYKLQPRLWQRRRWLENHHGPEERSGGIGAQILVFFMIESVTEGNLFVEQKVRRQVADISRVIGDISIY